MEKTKKLCLVYILMCSLAVIGMGTIEDDEKSCADQLTNLAACIPYVSGTSNKPTKECCDDTDKVRTSKPKCLCVLIKESTDPSLGLPINTTLALQMPSACNIDAKISDCPSLLNLPPDSPDAKIFKVATADSTSSSSTTPAASSSSSASPSSTSSSTSSPSSTSDTKTTSSTTSYGGQKLPQNLLLMIASAAIAIMLFL
ncbi:hypothetical protein M9H77_01841 [Catharanthus roseus]|uniref:Uncharacterized protein n=1 Tax=Catharanthus roseus TaxID=4058 RepID=A0ACC0C6P1_CATRO|nr:hypothetical protein M9H77_01841 [Catharanthus roseus]